MNSNTIRGEEPSRRSGEFGVLGWRRAAGLAVLGLIGLAVVAMRVASEPRGAAGARADAVFDAARRGDVIALRRAVDGGAMSVNAVETGSGMTLLMWAVRGQHPDAVQWLLTQGADLEARAACGTPLTMAPCNGDGSAMVRLLLAHGADPNNPSLAGRTALMAAAECGDAASAELLIAAGARVDARDRRGNTPLAIARAADADEIVRLLLAAGAAEPDGP